MSQLMDSLSEAQLFLRDKQAWENAIGFYKGNDPLELWFNYICWYDYNIHIDPDNKFKEVLEKCLSTFEHNELYKQDIRMIKLWMKYVDFQPNPLNLYQILYQRGVGTQCACFYIGWAHYYDSANAFKQAESVYNLGFQAKAEPYNELQDAHTKFRLSVSQRMLYCDSSSKKLSANNLIEQRHQITALNFNSVSNLTIKKNRPDQSDYGNYILYSNSCNQIQNSNIKEQDSLEINSNRQNDFNKNICVMSSCSINNEIKLENMKIPPNFTRYAKNNFETWKPLLFIEEPFELSKVCVYQKHLIYSGGDTEYSPEEIRSRKWFQKLQNSLNSSYRKEEINKYATNYQFLNQHHFNDKIPNHINDQVNNTSKNLQNRFYNSNTEYITDQVYINNKYDEINDNYYKDKSSFNASIQLIQQTLDNAKKKNKVDLSITLQQNDVNVDQNLERHKANCVLLCNSPNTKTCEKHNTSASKGNSINSNVTSSYILQRKDLLSRNVSKKNDEEKPVDLGLIGQNSNKSTRREYYEGKTCSSRKKEQFNQNHKSTQIGTTKNSKKNPFTDYNTSVKEQTSYDENFEEQVEASTIHFKTDTSDGEIKSKTITIKFRKKVSGSSSDKLQLNKHQKQHNECKKKKYCHSKSDDNLLCNFSSVCTDEGNKIKRIKIINNYSDSLDARVSNTEGIINSSQYEHEDSNLLPSTKTFSNDLNATNNCSSINIFQWGHNSLSSNDINTTCRNNYFPVSKLPQKHAKSPVTTSAYRNSKGLIKNLSVQSDDSANSYDLSNFFATEIDEDSEQKIAKALVTIETHLAKKTVDPFNSELCKAFLTKLNFPIGEANDNYKLIKTPLSKLSNAKTTILADITYNIEKEVGRGSYGSVYKAVNANTGTTVAIKYQRPPNIWEIYICNEVKKRIKNYNILPGFMNISSAIIAPNASIIITEFSSYGSLLDVNNKIRQATKKVMHESLAMLFSSQILDIVNYLHACKIIHADIKPDNFILMKVPNTNSIIPSLRLIDFGCAIDMNLFPDKMQFEKIIQTDGFTCTEMQEGKPWSYQTDLFCTAGTVHVLLFGEYMQVTKKYDQWDIKQKLPRYLKKHVWSEFFTKMLNIKHVDKLPNLPELKNLFDTELSKMNSELQMNIRTLSNILHRR